MPYRNTISQERLKEILSYDRETGEFRWKVSPALNVKVGAIAGSKNAKANGHRYIKVDKMDFTAQRLAWLYEYGKMPMKLTFRDGNKENLRIDNLVEMKGLNTEYDHSTPEGRSRYGKDYRAKYPNVMRDIQLRKTFGITREEYDAMHLVQGGKCAICGGDENTLRNGKRLMLAVDHHHGTGKVRSLLCSSCNKLIGFAKEDVSVLQRAIAYLARHADDDSKETVRIA